MMKKLFSLLFSLVTFLSLFGESRAEKRLKAMTIEEKIGQLFIAPACPLGDEKHQKDLKRLVCDYHIGGVILKQGGPYQYRLLMDAIGQWAKYPLLFLADAEWGLGMRMKDTLSFPKNLTLGAIVDDHLIYLMGKEIGRQCRSLGIHINLAPVVDVNNNAHNPIIHMRSFGENPENVARKSHAYMKGLQEEGVLACAKHFPGHGDTTTDSHCNLPTICHSKEHLEQIELPPFDKMISENIACIMTGHLMVPSLSQKPATFSKEILERLFQRKFQGLLITDALNMKALTLNYPEEEIALNALLAGHDLLLYGDHIAPNIDRILNQDIPNAFAKIKKAYEEGSISEKQIDFHVLKILQTKEKLSSSTFEALTTEYGMTLKKELFKQAITLVRDEYQLLPLKSQEYFSLHQDTLDLNNALPNTTVVVIIDDVNKLTEEKKQFINTIPSRCKNSLLVLYSSPYHLSLFKEFKTVVLSYENDPIAKEVTYDLLVGKYPFLGKLPITPL